MQYITLQETTTRAIDAYSDRTTVEKQEEKETVNNYFAKPTYLLGANTANYPIQNYKLTFYNFIKTVFHYERHDVENDRYIDEVFRRFWIRHVVLTQDKYFHTVIDFEDWIKDHGGVIPSQFNTAEEWYEQDCVNYTCRDKLIQLVTNIINTKDTYEGLIKIQEENIDKITDKLKSISQVKFNDTPQNNSNYSGDNFTSTITTSTSEVEIGNVADKLEIAKKALDDLYDKWLNAFDIKSI